MKETNKPAKTPAADKKPIKLEQKHWIVIAISSFALILTLTLCLAFCGKDDDKGTGGGVHENGAELGEEEIGKNGTIDKDAWDIN